MKGATTCCRGLSPAAAAVVVAQSVAGCLCLLLCCSLPLLALLLLLEAVGKLLLAKPLLPLQLQLLLLQQRCLWR
jgi:hypothetical protein